MDKIAHLAAYAALGAVGVVFIVLAGAIIAVGVMPTPNNHHGSPRRRY